MDPSPATRELSRTKTAVLGAVRVGVWADPSDALRPLLRNLAGVDIVGRATSLAGAARILSADAPDVVIVATARVVNDATAMVERFDATRRPLLILIGDTASEALAAFDMRAFDFISRPPTDVRLEAAFARVREWREQDRIVRLLNGAAILLSKQPMLAARARHVLPLNVNGRVVLVDTTEIELIESAGNWVTVVTPGREYLHRSTMNRCAASLRPHGFVRAHRRFLVNRHHVTKLTDRTVTLRSNRVIPCGRHYQRSLALLELGSGQENHTLG